MAYIVLAIGIALIIYGARGLDVGKNSAAAPKSGSVSGKGSFQQILFQREVLQRLEAIEEKLTPKEIGNSSQQLNIYNSSQMQNNHELSPSSGARTQLNIKPKAPNDLNNKIWNMNDEGMSIDEIAEKLGIGKGEIILRLGMKK